MKKFKKNKVLSPVYLSDWYYTKVKYPLKNKDSYYNHTNESYVYVVYNESSGFYKVGITSSIKNRIRQLRNQSGCNIDLVLFIQLHTDYDEDSKLVESLIHEFFNDRRNFGEWFNFDVKCLIAIRTLFRKIEGEDSQDNIKEHLKNLLINKIK